MTIRVDPAPGHTPVFTDAADLPGSGFTPLVRVDDRLTPGGPWTRPRNSLQLHSKF